MTTRFWPYRISLSRTDVGSELLTEFKGHVRVTGSAQDTDLTRYLDQAGRDFEDQTRRLLVVGTVIEYYDVWPWDWVPVLELHRAPVASFTKVEYYDSDGVLQEWDSSNYDTDLVDEPARVAVADDATDISPALDDRMNPVQVTYECGLVDTSGTGTAADLDAQVKNALFVKAAWLAGPGREMLPDVDPVALNRCWQREINSYMWTL